MSDHILVNFIESNQVIKSSRIIACQENLAVPENGRARRNFTRVELWQLFMVKLVVSKLMPSGTYCIMYLYNKEGS